MNLEVFQTFIADMQAEDNAGALPPVSLGDRVIVTVRSDTGQPIADARVVVTAAGAESQAAPLIDQPTRSDGRVLFAPGMDGAGEADTFNVTVYPPGGADPVTHHRQPGQY